MTPKGIAAEARAAHLPASINLPVRDLWINETALAGALNSAYMADKLSLFGIVVGAALLLSGIGFIVLALGAPAGETPVPDANVSSPAWLRRWMSHGGPESDRRHR